jgi:uncharacterized small protein (DUF1192 family)
MQIRRPRIGIIDLLMQRTLREHIVWLEEKIALLKVQQYDLERTKAERNQSSVDRERAEKALAVFQKIEQKRSN